MDTSSSNAASGGAQPCFGGNSPLYLAYHDSEWGKPVHGDTALFERLSLEAFSSGLSWFIVLRKRDHFREVFAGFEPDLVGAFGEADVDRLMGDAGIVRNRPKIMATIANARALTSFQAGGGSLDQLVWDHQPAHHRTPRTFADLASKTPESIALSKALKKIGFTWVGPTTCYATMQACGVVNDHLAGCPQADGSALGGV
ncbi:MAG: DNA-3-methyladenine glycosylase I [Micrococcales bacterium]|nr:DNA-3-methyladenine glycosylase I [Micrococcales bacterium]